MSNYGIILAAGASSRMGRPKPLLELDGQPLVYRTIRAVRAAGAEPVVVLGHRASKIAPHIEDAAVIINQKWRDGMSASLRAGVRRLPEDASRTLVLTVDQPDVDRDLLAQLLEACRAGRDAAGTRYPDGSLGVPACFESRLFDRLTDTTGDAGARAVLRSERWDVAAIDAPKRTFDVDTPEQWESFLETRQREEAT